MKLKSALLASTVATFSLIAAPAHAVLITFETLAVGTTLSNQFAALGVTFSPNAFSGSGGPTGDWATNTNMTIVSSTGADVGGLGTPSLVSGNLLRSFNGWLAENGDPSFSATFSTAITSFSADFAGVSSPASTRLFAYNGATLLGTAVGPAATTGQFTLSFAAASITRVVITPGDFFDWVAVDNINFTPSAIPEPQTYALMLLGLGVVGGLARRRQR